MKSPVYMWIKPNSPASGCNLNNYCYATQADGRPWLADIEEDQMFDPETFEIDPDPCGMGFKDEAQMNEWLESDSYYKKPAKQVGFIEDGKLFVLERIKVETGWGGFGPMVCTSHEYIEPNLRSAA